MSSFTERLSALKYVVHFIGDVHQPLHGGFADDRGGNGYQLQAWGNGTNLHQVWDSLMIQQWPGGVTALRAAVQALPPVPDVALAPVKWVEDDCRMVNAPDFYPATHVLDDAYVARWSPALAQRIAAAGQRLAAALNAALVTPRR